MDDIKRAVWISTYSAVMASNTGSVLTAIKRAEVAVRMLDNAVLMRAAKRWGAQNRRVLMFRNLLRDMDAGDNAGH